MHGKQIFFPRPYFNKRIIHDNKSHSRKSIKPKSQKLKCIVHLKQFFSLFDRAKIPYTCSKSSKHTIQSHIDTVLYHLVIGVFSHTGQPDKSGHNQIIRIIYHHASQLMNKHGSNIFCDIPARCPAWQFSFILFQKRIHPIRLDRNANICQHVTDNLNQKIRDKIAGQNQNQHLNQELDRHKSCGNNSSHILLLVRVNN